MPKTTMPEMRWATAFLLLILWSWPVFVGGFSLARALVHVTVAWVVAVAVLFLLARRERRGGK